MRRLFLGLLALLIVALPAHAQRFSGPSAPDPYVLNFSSLDPTIARDWNDPTGYTPANPRTIGGVKRCLLVFFGQSNSAANYQQDTYTLTSGSQEFEFNINSGGLYNLKWPLLGGGGPSSSATSNWTLRLADNLIAGATCDRVIIATGAIGSTFAADWASGGQMNQRISVMAKRIAANFSFAASAVIFQDGESDCNAGTLQATFNTNLTSAVNSIKTSFPGIPVFVSQTSYYNGTTCTAVTTPQANIVDNTTVFSLGNSDAIGSGGRWDNIHFNSTGNTSWASTVNTNLAAHMIVR